MDDLEVAAEASGEVAGEPDCLVAGGPEVGGEEDRAGGDVDERGRDDDHRRGQLAQQSTRDRAEAGQGAARVRGDAADDQAGRAECHASEPGLGGLRLFADDPLGRSAAERLRRASRRVAQVGLDVAADVGPTPRLEHVRADHRFAGGAEPAGEREGAAAAVAQVEGDDP
ncbi:hypothetical protein [Nannocystis pusilla]|uniref:hypothetical protein n=1 Tax=Nannocystis pusilla TaxID=889268 RepID=UPI003B7C32A5